ncbi:MAG: FAD:protein FMN transferase [Clostridia bacterium]|nr:FAD:protein FMN transferase [Clostridia bacterium]
MKILKKLALIPLACILIFAVAGCKKTGYGVYTNIPQGGYTLTDKTFKLKGQIEGYTAAENQPEAAEGVTYTTRGKLYYEMAAEAELVVAADFSTETAINHYNDFTSAVAAKLDEIGKVLSPTVTNSDIYNFNNAAAGATVEISKITYDVLQLALDIFKWTGGCYNPALYYNVEAYGFGNNHKYPQSSAELPDDETILKYTKLAEHFGEIILSKDEGYFVTKPTATVDVNGENLSMKLDLGGIGKGCAVDCIDKLFDDYGYKFGYFNFGASSMLVKNHDKNGSYNISFINPRSISRGTYLTTSISNEKLSTSGDYEQYYILDGTRYCHIIDPATGKPVQTGIMTVTVIGGQKEYTAAENDALTTALMCMGKDRAIKFIEEQLTDRRVAFTCL